MQGNGLRLRSEDLDAVVRPLPEATNLPGVLYSASEIYALEQEQLFAKMWVCIGRQQDLAESGDFVTVQVAGESIIVVRGDDGAPRAFYNVCRHRGSRLVQTGLSGSAKAFRCGYHAWTFGLRGELLAAPLMDECPGFRADAHSLAPLRLESWGGFLFVNLDAAALPLSESMKDFPDLSRYGLVQMQAGHRVSYEVAANWKVICENYSECYHCALVHPQLNRITDYRSGGRSEFGVSYNGGPMALGEGHSTMSMTGSSDLPVIAGLSKQDRRNVRYYNLYPNLLLGLAPDYVLVHTAWPLGPDRTRVVCDWLFPPATLESDGFDAGSIIEFWDVTNRQDWGLCESVQAASGSRAARPGPYHSTEACVHAFDKWYVEFLGASLRALAR